MALLKSESAREVETLETIEKNITRREKVHHALIIGLSALLLVSAVGHVLRCVAKR